MSGVRCAGAKFLPRFCTNAITLFERFPARLPRHGPGVSRKALSTGYRPQRYRRCREETARSERRLRKSLGPMGPRTEIEKFLPCVGNPNDRRDRLLRLLLVVGESLTDAKLSPLTPAKAGVQGNLTTDRKLWPWIPAGACPRAGGGGNERIKIERLRRTTAPPRAVSHRAAVPSARAGRRRATAPSR